MRHDVAVITINYNSSDFTVSCVHNLIAKTDPNFNYHIVIVDNNSTQDEYEKLDKVRHIDNVTVVRSKINSGFAAGNIYGIQFVSAKYYFFLNNDCLTQNDCITILYDFCEKTPNAALCSPQLYNDNKQPVPSFDYFPEITSKFLGKGIFRITRGKDYYPRKKIPTEPIKVEVLSGSQLFVNSKVFNKIGGFDTIFFLYCEEEDLALRIHKEGHDTYLVPGAHNWHLGGASTTEKSFSIQKEFIISYLYLYRKHYGLFKTQLLKLLLLLRYTKRSIKNPANLQIILFIITGAHPKNSLRHQQPINE